MLGNRHEPPVAWFPPDPVVISRGPQAGHARSAWLEQADHRVCRMLSGSWAMHTGAACGSVGEGIVLIGFIGWFGDRPSLSQSGGECQSVVWWECHVMRGHSRVMSLMAARCPALLG